MMNIVDVLKLKFPSACFVKDICVQDDSDGKGAYIKEWNLTEPQPTNETLDTWKIEVGPEYIKQQKSVSNADINKQLDQIDQKSIRALRTNDTVRLAELEAQAVKLRGKLV